MLLCRVHHRAPPYYAGNRVGVWRMLDLFDELGLPMAVLANASIYRYCPSVMDAFRARNAEVTPPPSVRRRLIATSL